MYILNTADDALHPIQYYGYSDQNILLHINCNILHKINKSAGLKLLRFQSGFMQSKY